MPSAAARSRRRASSVGFPSAESPAGDAEIEPLRELGEAQLDVPRDRFLERVQDGGPRPSDRLGEGLGLRVGLRGTLQRSLCVRQCHPAPGGKELSERRHALEQERREGIGPFETQTVGEPLQPVAEPIGHPGSAFRRDRAERVVGQELTDRCDLDPSDLLGRELRRRRELPEPLDLVAPVLEPHRTPRDAREHVHDPTPNGELSPALDHVHPQVAELREPFRERIRRELHAGRELDRSGGAQGRRHRLHRGEVRGDHDERSFGDAEAADGVGPPGRHLGRRVHPLVRQGVPRGKERDAVRSQVGADLGSQLLRFARTGCHDEEGSVQRDREPGEDGVLPGVDLGHDGPCALEQQALERRGADERVEHLPERHPTSPQKREQNAKPQREQPRSRRDGASEGRF